MLVEEFKFIRIIKVVIIMQTIGKIRTLMKILKMNNKDKKKKRKKKNWISKLIMKIWIKILIGIETYDYFIIVGIFIKLEWLRINDH